MTALIGKGWNPGAPMLTGHHFLPSSLYTIKYSEWIQSVVDFKAATVSVGDCRQCADVARLARGRTDLA
jgi:hypothetical protein